jgi:hypothetical protein
MMKRMMLLVVGVAISCSGCQPSSPSSNSSGKAHIKVDAPGVNIDIERQKDKHVNPER